MNIVIFIFPKINILFLSIIITALVLAPFLYLLTLSFPLKRSWKKMDKPFDEVVEVVERALIRKGIPFRRLTSNEYKEKGANEKLCRIERLSGTRSYNVLFYDLDRDDQIIIVGEWGREEETRVNILICYDGERDEVLMNDVKKEIDWELRKLD